MSSAFVQKEDTEQIS